MSGDKNYKAPFLLVKVSLWSTLLAMFVVTTATAVEIFLTNSSFEIVCYLLFIFCQLFGLVHALGYLINVSTSISSRIDNSSDPSNLNDSLNTSEAIVYQRRPPPVAVVVCSYKEPLDILERTLICFRNLNYPKKQLYFLDDTRYDDPKWTTESKNTYKKEIESLCTSYKINLFRRKWRGAKAGIINDFLSYINGSDNPDFQMHYARAEDKKNKPEFLAVFDADQNPMPDFLDSLVPEFIRNDNLAFVQTPQYYTNIEEHLVAKLAGLGQSVFFEYVCEGKGQRGAIFCCGTNFVMRIKAVNEVGGFDEGSVTEDAATSFQLHLNGWTSKYIAKVKAFGEGPHDLAGYFSQQNRWALGTTGLFRKVVAAFLDNPKKLKTRLWWEYFLTSTHYFIGWFTFLNFLFVPCYLFFGIPRLFGNFPFIFLVFFPQFLLILASFLWPLVNRGYRYKDLMFAMLIAQASFPVYMKGTLYGLLGKKSKFAITSKSGRSELPIKAFWPQLMIAGILTSAITWAFLSILFTSYFEIGLLLILFWGLYGILTNISILIINSSEL